MRFTVAVCLLLAATATASNLRVDKETQYARRLIQAPKVGDAPIDQLSAGTPYYDSVQTNSYKFYSLTIDSSANTVVDVDITPFSGDPDVFISTDSSNHYPSWTKYNYASIGFEAEHLTVEAGDSQNKCPTTGNCTLYISVYGFSNSTYLIWTSALGTLTELANGVPAEAHAVSGHYTYFSFYAGVTGEDVVFQTTVNDPGASEWELSLYASTNAHTTAPTASNSLWSSIGDNSYHYTNVDIKPSDPLYCSGPGCKYYVGILAPSHHTEGIFFSMLATNGPTFVHLIEGLKQMGHVARGKSQLYFADLLPGATQTNITVVPQSDNTGGDPDIYVTVGNKGIPSSTNYIWRSIDIGGDRVTIDHSDPEWTSNCSVFGCDVHIAVYAFQESTYSITVSQSGSQPTPNALPAAPLDSYHQ